MNLTTIRRSSDGFAVRHVVIDLDRLITSRDGLLDREPGPDPPYRYTEQSLLDLDAAVQVAAAKSAQSCSTPIPALAAWKTLGGAFEDQFEWSNLRPHVHGLPRRPLWQRAVRSALSWAGVAVTVFFAVLAAEYQVSAYDDDASLTDLLCRCGGVRRSRRRDPRGGHDVAPAGVVPATQDTIGKETRGT